MRRKLTAMACVIVLALGLSACGGQGTGGGDAFTVRVVCQSEDVYQIFYTCYVGGESRGMGGMADLEGGELTEDTDLTLTFPRSCFEEGDDVGTFSMDFSPYGENDTSELATTARLSIPAAYGTCCTVVFSGDRETGFTAALQE